MSTDDDASQTEGQPPDNDAADLAATVDEQDERIAELEATVAKMLPTRREALAAGGVAAAGLAGFGTGSASAAASTSDSDSDIGTPSNRGDAFLDGLDANSVQIDDGTITSLDGADLQYDSGDIGEINSEFYIEIGDDVQAELNAPSTPADGLNVFHLETGENFNNVTPPLTIPERTRLDLNDSRMLFDGDGTDPCIVLGAPHSYLSGPGRVQFFDSGNTLTAGVIKVDSASGNFSNTIRAGEDNTVGVFGYPRLQGSPGDGPGLVLDTTDHAITVGCLFQIVTTNFDVHVQSLSNNNHFTNGARVDAHSWAVNDTWIDHKNTTGSEGDGGVLVTGEAQSSSPAAYCIRNQTAQQGPVVDAQIFDPSNYGTSLVSGPNIRLRTENAPGKSVLSTPTGEGTIINGIGYRQLGGSAPDATNWETGDMVVDENNTDDVYLIYDPSVSGGVTQIGT